MALNKPLEAAELRMLEWFDTLYVDELDIALGLVETLAVDKLNIALDVRNHLMLDIALNVAERIALGLDYDTLAVNKYAEIETSHAHATGVCQRA
jgi:hypothetical protein